MKHISNDSLNRQKQVLENRTLTLVAYCMILSDCFTIFGGWVYYLKFLGLAVVVIYLLYRSCSEKTLKPRVLLGLLGLTILLIISIMQGFTISDFLSIALFTLVAITAILGDKAFHTYESMYYCGVACVVLISCILLLTLPECISQMNATIASGRPRLKGGFSNQNSLGHIAAISLCMVFIGRVKFCEGIKQKIFGNLALVICSFFVILSGSRTAQACCLGFILLSVYGLYKSKATTKQLKFLLSFLVCIGVVCAAVMLYQNVKDEFLASGRLLEWKDLGSIESLIGYGYASSSNISYITEIAGGYIEMLFISAYYRIGIVGIFAYVLLLFADIYSETKRNPFMTAFLLFVFFQSIGESYFTSVMAYPALFDWLILGGLSRGLDLKPTFVK